MRRVSAFLALAILACVGGQAVAQTYPSRVITLIVPFPPGGGNDTIARLVAQGLSNALGQQVVVENRGGANGVIAMRQAAKAAPDGYTLVFANSSSTSINIALYSNPGYDMRRDFAPIGNIAQMGIGIVSHPDFPAKSVGELIALAKKQPGKLSFGTSPPGSGSHLAAELFKATTGIDVTLVPYKGAAALTTDVLGNHIPVIFSVMPPALGNIQQGKLRVIAVTTPTRMALLPATERRRLAAGTLFASRRAVDVLAGGALDIGQSTALRLKAEVRVVVHGARGHNAYSAGLELDRLGELLHPPDELISRRAVRHRNDARHERS